MPSSRTVRRTIAPLRDFLRTESAGGVVLLVATVLALSWANSPWRGGYESLWSQVVGAEPLGLHLRMQLGNWVDDALMTAFFLVVGLEIKREASSGHLASRDAIALPFAAALGGMAVPAVVYLAVAGRVAPGGWGVPMATDIALALAALAVVGRSLPSGARVLLLGLAVIDDVGAIIVIALVYSGGVQAAWLGAAGAALSVAALMSRRGVQSVALVAPVGAFMWLALHEAGVHATLAGVAMGLLAPNVPRRGTALVDADDRDAPSAPGSVSVVEWLLHALHPWSAFVALPVFALANAGIRLGSADMAASAGSTVTWAVAAGLVLGKPVGVVLGAWVAVRSRVARLPDGLGWRGVVAVGCAAGIGFTVALFVSDLAFVAALQRRDATVGILAASVASVLACGAAARWARPGTSRRRSRSPRRRRRSP